MQAKDDQLWGQQLIELGADEMSRLFREFLVAWADLADQLAPDYPTFIDAATESFQETEKALGFISVEWLGQMLLLLVQHWIHGDELWESLSVWERRLVEQATALKLAELADQAAGSLPETQTLDTP